jgi:hypothetical protein
LLVFEFVKRTENQLPIYGKIIYLIGTFDEIPNKKILKSLFYMMC